MHVAGPADKGFAVEPSVSNECEALLSSVRVSERGGVRGGGRVGGGMEEGGVLLSGGEGMGDWGLTYSTGV